MKTCFCAVSSVVVLASAAACGEVPLGSAEFRPTPERPIGYRGDGNGCFPGARVPTEFWDGTPVEVEGKNKRGQVTKVWDIADTKSKNIRWKTEMLCWANTQPIVVGDKVLTKAEPNLLVCVDAESGKILWTQSANAWQCAGVEPKLAAQAQALWEIACYAEPAWWAFTSESTMSDVRPARDVAQFLALYKSHVQPRILAGLKELDPQGSYDAAAKAVIAGVEAHVQKLEAGEQKAKARPGDLRAAIEKRIEALTGKRRFPMDIPWYNLVGNATSVPVSDGERVYASFGQGQVAAWTLDGQPVWGVWLPRPEGNSAHCAHIPSPVLADGILMVNQDHKTMVGLDAKTGKQLWAFDGGTSGGSYSVGTAKVARLKTASGETLPVVVTMVGRIVRIADGKQVGDLNHPELRGPNWSSGPSIIVVGDVLLKGGGNGGTYTAYRLAAADRNTVTATKLYDLGPRANAGPMGHCANERLFFAAGAVRDLATGKALHDWKRSVPPMNAGNNNMLIGQHLLLVDSGDGHPSEKYGLFQFHDLSATPPAQVKSVNILKWSKPRNPVMEKYAKELYDLPFYCNNSGGYPFFFGNVDTSFMPHGDSLYVRSTSHLYRIGPQ